MATFAVLAFMTQQDALMYTYGGHFLLKNLAVHSAESKVAMQESINTLWAGACASTNLTHGSWRIFTFNTCVVMIQFEFWPHLSFQSHP